MDSILSFTLNNLTTIISQESSLLGGLKGELQSIKDELGQMRAFLKRSEFLVENDPSLKVWAGQVRDVSYDVEDVLDEFMLRCTHRHSNGMRGQVLKIKNMIITLKARHQIASEIKKIRNRIASISEAHKRYQTQYGGAADSIGSTSHVMRNTMYERRGDALLLKESDLVGIEDSKTELKEKLLSEDVRRNVISVVGMGGLGKTTLVKKVYDGVNVRSSFTYMMWITVPESFKLEELLTATIRHILKKQNRSMSCEELQDLDLDGQKQLILELLQSEKYLVVYDDVWSQAYWDAIHLAFPRNKCGSRVFITTRNSEQVRRLAIHGTLGNVNGLGCTCKSLRSIVSYDSRGSISKSDLHSLLHNGQRLLKVVDIRDASLNEIPTEIFTLVHLKCLSLRSTKVTSIPKSIGKLENLETLDLKHTYVTELPIEILKLQKLRHILVYVYQPSARIAPFKNLSGFRAPYKIGGLKSLQKLNYIEADVIGDVNIVKEIGNLTQLRRLGVIKLRREDGKEFCSSLGKLTQLCSLSVVSFEEDEVIDLQYCLSSNLPFLRTLYMIGRLEKVPQWISSLEGLSVISLRYSRLRSDPLKYLQDLPNLVHLHLSNAYDGVGLSCKAGGFPKLKTLFLTCLPGLRRLILEESSMPLLEELEMYCCKSMVEFPVGMHHLVHLQHLLFADMPATFRNELENMDKESNEHQWILEVSMVVIQNYVDGRWQKRSLDRTTSKTVITSTFPY